jgi:hypothetical protein
MLLALTTPEAIDLAIAGATFLLALGTFWMAWGTRVLAKTTTRQHDEATTPVLRLGRISPPGDVDLCIVNEGSNTERFVAVVENCGPVAAEVLSCRMTDLGDGQGRDELTVDPVLGPGANSEIDFIIDPAAKDRLHSGDLKTVTITYLASATGRRFRVVEQISCTMEGPRTRGNTHYGPRERWRLEASGPPEAL